MASKFSFQDHKYFGTKWTLSKHHINQYNSAAAANSGQNPPKLPVYLAKILAQT
jgi:hypothetical protein